MASKSIMQFSTKGAISSPSILMMAASPRLWITSFACQSILSALTSTISSGYLIVDDAEGSHMHGSNEKGCNLVHIKIRNNNFWLRLMLEAYMIGDIELPNLRAAMNLWLDNQSTMEDTLSSTFSHITLTLSSFYNSFLGQTKSNTRLNVITSYNQSNELFKAFLSSEMIPTPGDLEAAQQRKIHHVLCQACLKPGYRVLEFSSGWGGLVIEAASTFGCTIDTLMLSIKQKRLAEERIAAAGLSDKIHVHLLDYRDIPSEWENAFDAFVSVEMLEYIGSKHYSNYF
ncbi:Mycolic acid cyclopropane synthetase-domain-containing protein [Desarmillaria tabescens]|uniref:Mycolic acid cyclopropane synthetase-domain-containing protein n=1 Tax=Armillaria tabescens TaxID=1929756 RepID=A0AA39J6B2_ARMTA|nr:Mycolic acid cyclopropane synthetase-domain-containing protein [Desarmillaria tabescens]KAK0436061.1 Mycolic acid cyclopropane synthetase-domain-containing protein [Desarmillaria tabescens]